MSEQEARMLEAMYTPVKKSPAPAREEEIGSGRLVAVENNTSQEIVTNPRLPYLSATSSRPPLTQPALAARGRRCHRSTSLHGPRARSGISAFRRRR